MLELETGILREQQKAVTDVERFLTRVWEHPLLSDQTKQMRERARTEYTQMARSFEVDEKSYIGIPVGSYRWISNGQSDFDFLTIAIDDRIPFLQNLDSYDDKIGDIDFLVGRDTKEHIEKAPLSNMAVQLLFTPDEHLVGNIQAAREIRLRLVQEISDMGEVNIVNMWDSEFSEVRRIFKYYFTGWPDSLNKRLNRYNAALTRRSLQTHDPKRWQEVFGKSLEKMEVPPFSVYSAALKVTNGALRTNPRFAAVGIQNSNHNFLL